MGERAGVFANIVILVALVWIDAGTRFVAPLALTASFVLSLLLPIFTLRRSDSGFSLPLFLINLILYLAIAAMVNLRIGIEYVDGIDLVPVETYREAIYFTIVTFTTLGYGDYRPSTDLQVWAALQALYGYVSLGLILAAFVHRARIAGRDGS